MGINEPCGEPFAHTAQYAKLSIAWCLPVGWWGRGQVDALEVRAVVPEASQDEAEEIPADEVGSFVNNMSGELAATYGSGSCVLSGSYVLR